MTDRKWHFAEEGANDMVGACGAPLKYSAKHDKAIPLDDMGDSACSFTPGVNCQPCRLTRAFQKAESERQGKLSTPNDATVTKKYAETHTIQQPESKHLWHSPSFGWDDMPGFDQITIPKTPLVIVTDGEHASMFDDRFKGPVPDSIPPIVLASYIARLRALADILENS